MVVVILMTETIFLQTDIKDIIELFLYTAGSAISAVLVALSISAYQSTGLKKLRYAIVAFGLFCVFLTYEMLESVFSYDDPFTDVLIPISALVILVFFFLAVIKKK